jgi:hypothetical protein
VTSAEAGQSVSLALKRVRRAAVRKGMVIVHKTEAAPPRGETLAYPASLRRLLIDTNAAVRQFEGQVLIL